MLLAQAGVNMMRGAVVLQWFQIIVSLHAGTPAEYKMFNRL